MLILKRIAEMLLTKKKILAWIAAILIAVFAAVFGISPEDIKEAVKDAPVIQLPVASPQDGK